MALWPLTRNGPAQNISWKDQLDACHCQAIRIFLRSRSVVGVSSNGTVHLWDLLGRTHLKAVDLGHVGMAPEWFSPDKRWLIGQLPGERSVLCDLQNARSQPLPLRGWNVYAQAAAFSDDSRWLAHSTTNNGVALIELATGTVARHFQAHRSLVNALSFSPNGDLLASGGSDGDIWVWRAATGQPYLPVPLKGHQSNVSFVTFSEDGKTLASASTLDVTLRLWNVTTGQEMLLLPLPPAGKALYDNGQAELAPGGQWWLSQDAAGGLEVLTLAGLKESRLNKDVALSSRSRH